MKTLITVLAVTAVFATSAAAKTQRHKEVRPQPINSVRHDAVTRSPTQSIHTAASIAGRPILTAESSSSFTATVGIGNSKSDTGVCNIRLATANRHTRGARSLITPRILAAKIATLITEAA